MYQDGHNIMVDMVEIMRRVVEVNGIKTSIRSMIWTRTKSDQICPLCRKKIKAKDKIYLLINNYKLFPNIIIHDECILDTGTIFGDLDWKNTIKKLKEDYEQAARSRNHNMCWFGN